MKHCFLYAVIILFSCNLYAQRLDSIAFEKKVVYFKNQITQSKNQASLSWLDSLTTLVQNKREYSYDSIAKITIAKALSLQSFDQAAKHTSALLGYYNNYTGEPARGLEFYKTVQADLSGKLNPLREASLYIDLGDAYDFTDNDNKAIETYDKTIAIAQKNDLGREGALATLYKGFVLSDNGKFAPAAQQYQKAEIYFTKVQDTTRLISIKNSLSILYSKNFFFNEASKAREEGIALAKAGNRKDQLVSFYYNTAIDLSKQSRYNEEIKTLLKAYTIAKETERVQYYEPIFLSSLVKAYARTANLSKAEEYLKKLDRNQEGRKGDKSKLHLDAQKHYAFAKADYSNSLSLSKKHLTLLRQDKQSEEITNAELFISNVYDKLGSPEKAYSHYKNYSTIRDSINGIQNVKALTYYQTLYETEKRDAQIAAQQSDIAILDASNREKVTWIIAGGLGLLSIFGVILLARSRNAAKRRREEQENFSQELLRTQEEERKRIAQDLHDSVGGSLALAKNKLQSLTPLGTIDPQMEEMIKILDTTGEQVRQISHNILPGELVKFGLVSAVNDMVDTINSDTIEVHFFAHKMEERIDPEKEVHLFRVVQEILHNALKHAKAQNIFINLTKHPNYLNLMIEDDGVGYNMKEVVSGIGLKNMKNRIDFLRGSLQVHSSLGKGTSTTISIPL